MGRQQYETRTKSALDYLDIRVANDVLLECRHSAKQAAVFYEVLRNCVGRLRATEAYRACGINPTEASREQIARFKRVVGELGWKFKRCSFDGVLRDGFVKQGVGEKADISDVNPFMETLRDVLGGRTGKLRVSDAFRICGLDPDEVSQHEITQVGRAMRTLGWQRQRRRFDGGLQYTYVKGSFNQQSLIKLVTKSKHTTQRRKRNG